MGGAIDGTNFKEANTESDGNNQKTFVVAQENEKLRLEIA